MCERGREGGSQEKKRKRLEQREKERDRYYGFVLAFKNVQNHRGNVVLLRCFKLGMHVVSTGWQ